jgi:CxxC motif-containing protein (DUF1111 family)
MQRAEPMQRTTRCTTKRSAGWGRGAPPGLTSLAPPGRLPSAVSPARRWLLALGLGLLVACGGGGGGGGGSPPDETLAGGELTVFNTTRFAFSQRAPTLDQAGQDAFQVGDAFFSTTWTTAPSSARDGLGPLFNANGCAACHTRDGRGRPPLATGEPFVSLLFRSSVPGPTPTAPPSPVPAYGGQLQVSAILGVAPEAAPEVTYTDVPGSFGDGTPFTLARPSYTFPVLAYGPLPADVQISPRVAPQMIGLGLLASVAEADILARADDLDADGDGISGRANRVPDLVSGDPAALGRFGWKAGQPTIGQQVAAAFRDDVGITNPLFLDEACTSAQADCLAAPSGGSPEADGTILDFVTFYSHHLAVPARRAVADPEVARGRALVEAIGCTACHVPTLVTGPNPLFPALAGQVIHPWTDLLLHDLGPDLADDRPEALADGREWRTPPLWGVGLVETVNEHTRYLHDGRARNLAEAILWHGGEAEAARERFRLLAAADRAAVIRFLEDL